MNKKRYSVLFAAVGINFVSGLLYIWSILSKGLVSEFGWSSTEASLPYTVATVSFVVAMLIFGKIQDTKGPRFTGIISGLLIGGGLILSGLTVNPTLMVLSFGVMTGAGIGVSSISATPPCVNWFPPEKKGLITGVVVAGVALASVFYAPLTNYLINSVGISNTFLYIGVGALIAIVLMAQFLANPPETDKTADAEEAIAPASSAYGDLAPAEILKRSEFYMLWIMFCFASSAGLMVIGHIANITKIQIGWEGGYLLVILLAVFNGGGRILAGYISDKIGRVPLMRLVFALQAANMLLFQFYNSVALLGFGAALAGFCYGSLHAVFPAATLDLYGVKNYGFNFGLIMTAWGVSGVIGPMIAASALDATQSYRVAYYISCGLLLAALAISVMFTARTKAKE